MSDSGSFLDHYLHDENMFLHLKQNIKFFKFATVIVTGVKALSARYRLDVRSSIVTKRYPLSDMNN